MASKLDHRIATAEGMYQAEVHKRENAEAALDAVKKRRDEAIDALASECAKTAAANAIIATIKGDMHLIQITAHPNDPGAYVLGAEAEKALLKGVPNA